MNGFSVDLESLRHGAASLRQLGLQLGDQIEAFDGTQASFGTPWGGDIIGGILATAYVETVEYAMACFDIAAEEISAAGEDVAGMAGALETTDQAIADDLAGFLSGTA